MKDKGNLKVIKRHAYMIIAHDQEELLQILIRALDSIENDIFVHIDKDSSINMDKIKCITTQSKLCIIPRQKVSWGGYSLVKVEMALLKEATQRCSYSYYHLLSGVDLPLKGIEEVNEFYNSNYGKQFINIRSPKEFRKYYNQRVAYKMPFKERWGKEINFFKVADKLLVQLQKIFGLKNKNLEEKDFCFGSQWWDITDDLARYILDNSKYIEKTYKYSSCADEVFVQSLILNTKYWKDLYVPKFDNQMRGNMRWITIPNGKSSPITINEAVLEEANNSGMLWARKFDYKHSQGSIEKLIGMIL
jgi:hypothetical protein